MDLVSELLDSYHSTVLTNKLLGFCGALGLKKKEGEELITGSTIATVEVESNTEDRRMFAIIDDKEKGRLVVTDANANFLDTIDFKLNNEGEWNEYV